MSKLGTAWRAAAALSWLTSLSGQTLAQEDVAAFYTGKTVRIVVGAGLGSGYDITARVIARHIGNHLPGNPQVVVQNQPGADSLTMTQQLCSTGPKDGTAIGAASQTLPTASLLAPDTRRFDAAKLNWIGSANRDTQITYSWHTVPIKTIEDIRQKKFVVGSQAPGTLQNDFPIALNRLFGLQFSVVNGYDSTAKIHRAMERGEVHGIAAVSWSAAKALVPQWIAERKINIVAQFGLRPHRELQKVPMWLDIATTVADRQAIELLLTRLETDRPYFLPPDVPGSRVQAIRRAFDATMQDSGFLAEAAAAKIEIDPMSGEDLASLVARLDAIPRDVVAKVRVALENR